MLDNARNWHGLATWENSFCAPVDHFAIEVMALSIYPSIMTLRLYVSQHLLKHRIFVTRMRGTIRRQPLHLRHQNIRFVALLASRGLHQALLTLSYPIECKLRILHCRPVIV
jgi:hypothetical protein